MASFNEDGDETKQQRSLREERKQQHCQHVGHGYKHARDVHKSNTEYLRKDKQPFMRRFTKSSLRKTNTICSLSIAMIPFSFDRKT